MIVEYTVNGICNMIKHMNLKRQIIYLFHVYIFSHMNTMLYTEGVDVERAVEFDHIDQIPSLDLT